MVNSDGHTPEIHAEQPIRWLGILFVSKLAKAPIKPGLGRRSEILVDPVLGNVLSTAAGGIASAAIFGGSIPS